MALSDSAWRTPARAAKQRLSLGRTPGAAWRVLGAILLAALCGGPALAIAIQAASSLVQAPAALLHPLWLESLLGTISLALLGGGGAAALGAGAALLISLCRFPGRGLFELLLAAPLAAPAYVLAYAYGAMTGPGGPAPLGWDGQTKTALVYALAFYPYVYLATRAGLLGQPAGALEAARALGASPLAALGRVILPLARPAIAAGTALALMECVADYGAAAFFGASSLATGVFRAWYAQGDPGLAMQLSAGLLLAAMVLIGWERASRRGRIAATANERWRAPPRYRLGLWHGMLAALFCCVLLAVAAGLPLFWLARLAWLDQGNWARLADPLARSLLLAGVGVVVTLSAAAAAASLMRAGGRLGARVVDLAAAGYAAPGAVIALGALAWTGWARGAGMLAGLAGAASLAVLIWAYAARFTAAGAQPIAAGLLRVSPSVTAAARTLGAGPWRRFCRIELPIATPSLLAGGLIIFVEVLKELPATLILRPLDWDTLAVRAHAYAADERLVQAAAPALLITLAGLGPLLLFTYGMARSRTGEKAP